MVTIMGSSVNLLSRSVGFANPTEQGYTYISGPELLFAGVLHLALTLWAGLHVPDTNPVAATLQTQTAHFAPVGGCHIGDDAAHDDVLNRMAVGTRHRHDLLTEQATPLIYIGLVTAVCATVFLLPSHERTR